MFGHQNPGPGSGSGFVFGSVLTKNAGSGSALKPMRICITGEKTEANFFGLNRLENIRKCWQQLSL